MGVFSREVLNVSMFRIKTQEKLFPIIVIKLVIKEHPTKKLL